MDLARRSADGAAVGEPERSNALSSNGDVEKVLDDEGTSGLGWPAQPTSVDVTPGTLVGLGWGQ